MQSTIASSGGHITKVARRAFATVTPRAAAPAGSSAMSDKMDTLVQRMTSLVLQQRKLQGEAPSVQTTIAGVTFEGRQAAVCTLQRDQPLILMHEPSNPYDPAAVHVQTLSGVSLGYVPREINDVFIQGVPTTGSVVSAGQVRRVSGPGPWGAIMTCRPTALALLPVPLPSAYPKSGEARLVSAMVLPGSAAHTAAAARAGGRCEITGVEPDEGEALVATPLWALDTHAHIVRLKRLALLHPLLAQAMDWFRIQRDDELYNPISALVAVSNGWNMEETDEYRWWGEDLQAEMDAEGWTVRAVDDADV